MALISCSECEKDVSDKAASCPNCGAPISESPLVSISPKSHVNATRTGAKWEGSGFILILLGIVSGVAFMEGTLAGLLIAVGFVVFIIGRFK